MSSNRSDQPKARLSRGFVDRAPHEIKAAEKMTATIARVYELYGFEPVETPLIEYTDALGKFLPDQDRPNEGVFSFQDDDEQWLSLRYDLTAPLARYVAENYEKLPKPYRSYRAGWVFRNEKPGPGRFRQFMQFDADTVGAGSVAADAEICMMAADTLEALGSARGDYVIKVNNRKVLDGVMEVVGLAGDEFAGTRLTVLRAIDKLDKVGEEGVADLLGKGRLDPSGDFTKGAGLGPDAIATVLAFTRATASDVTETLARLTAVVGASAKGSEGVEELRTIAALCDAGGYQGRVEIDPSVVRGLEYYTGPVFEAQLTFEVKDEDGTPVRFGSVGGGGRYDGLVGRFLKEDVPATGFSIGLSRLMHALGVLGKLGSAADEKGPIVVLVMDKGEIAAYQKIVADLRHAGIRAELYLGSSGMKAQMKYADRRRAPAVVIQGSDERTAGTVTIKDLDLGKELSATIADNATWKAARPAQQTIPISEMIPALKAIIEG